MAVYLSSVERQTRDGFIAYVTPLGRDWPGYSPEIDLLKSGPIPYNLDKIHKVLLVYVLLKVMFMLPVSPCLITSLYGGPSTLTKPSEKSISILILYLGIGTPI